MNNSSNPELIWTKFYSEMRAQMGRFPGNFAHPQSNAAKMAQKNLTFCQQYNTSILPLSSGQFALNLDTVHESVWSKILLKKKCEIFPIRDHLPQQLTF